MNEGLSLKDLRHVKDLVCLPDSGTFVLWADFSGEQQPLSQPVVIKIKESYSVARAKYITERALRRHDPAKNKLTNQNS